MAALWSISSSSLTFIVSPNYFATLLMLLILMKPVLSSLNKSNILLIPFCVKQISYSWFFVTESGSDTVQKLLKVYLATLSFKVSDHVENRWIFWFEPQWLHCGFQLTRVNLASGFSIKQIESFSELFDFILSESRSFDFLLSLSFNNRLSSHN